MILRDVLNGLKSSSDRLMTVALYLLCLTALLGGIGAIYIFSRGSQLDAQKWGFVDYCAVIAFGSPILGILGIYLASAAVALVILERNGIRSGMLSLVLIQGFGLPALGYDAFRKWKGPIAKGQTPNE